MPGSRGFSFIEQPEILDIFGVMPLCLVFEGKKGTVCRAGLDRRVQSKCFVAELLSREQKVARIVAVSFLLHQINLLFFLFLWEAEPAAPAPMHVGRNEMSTAAGISVQDILKHQNKDMMKSGALWSVTNNALSTPNLSLSQSSCLKRLKGRWGRLSEKPRQVSMIHDKSEETKVAAEYLVEGQS